MDLLNRVVTHKKFGKGTIMLQEFSKVTVQFNESIGKKIFQYPEGFELFLKLNDESLTEVMNDMILKKREIKQKEISERHRLWNIRTKKETKKTSKHLHKNNMAIKCNFCDGGSSKESFGYKGVCSDPTIKHNIMKKKHTWCCSEDSLCLKYLNGEISRNELDLKCLDGGFVCYESQMLKEWRAYAGIVQTGVRKGQPMVFRDLSSNMLAILTTRLPGMEEQNRMIFAVFIVMGRCEGDEEIEGYIEANPEYRIELSLEEAVQVKFWNYYYNEKKPEVIRMGSGLHRYISDNQAVQILKKMIEVKSDHKEKEYVINFLKHYCEVKNIDVDLVPEPEGGLTRLN